MAIHSNAAADFQFDIGQVLAPSGKLGQGDSKVGKHGEIGDFGIRHARTCVWSEAGAAAVPLDPVGNGACRRLPTYAKRPTN